VADVFANALGGLAGAVAGVVVGTTADAFIARAAAAGLTDSATFYPLLIATIVVVAGAWEPFDVTLDVGSVVPKLKLFLRDPVQLGVLTDEGLSFLQHLLFTSALVLWLKEARVRSAMKIAAIVGVLVAFGCEGVQLFIGARMPGLEDAGVAAAGALVGVAAGLEFRRSTTYARWCAGLFGLTAVGVAMQQLSPFQIVTGALRPFQWMPFLNYYAFTTSETVSHSAELLLSYFPLGFGFALAVLKPTTRLAVVLGVALAIAVPVEYLQRFIGGRYPDITDIGLSVAGAWLGAWTATQGWRLFDEQMALPRQSLAR
jgi:VanZ family protein